jgi:hypothetical protein
VETSYRSLVGFHVVDLPGQALDHWRLQGGKWFWFHDPAADRQTFFGLPIGEAPKPGGAKPEPNLAQAIPKDTSPEAVAAAARAAIQSAPAKSMFDKESMEFVLGTAGTQELVVRNGYGGQVRVMASVPGETVGITVEPAEAVLDARAEVTFKIHYLPLYRQPASTAVAFEFQPFHKVFSFPVKVSPAPAAAPEAAKP